MAQRIQLDGGGWLEVQEQGAYVQLSAQRKHDTEGLYKVHLLGNHDSYLLGTMIPEGPILNLRRTISRSTLIQHGVWPIIGGKAEMVYPFTDTANKEKDLSWHWEHRPSKLFFDAVLAEAATNWGSVLHRTCSGGFALAAPFDPRHPFPFTPIFCFGCISTVDAKSHVIFYFSPDGTPIFPDHT